MKERRRKGGAVRPITQSGLGRIVRCRSCRKPRYCYRGKNVCIGCETRRRRRAKGLCNAVLWHGPGHQSQTFCAATKHEILKRKLVHRCSYSGGEAEWFGREKATGYFDDPPTLESER